MKRYFSNQHSNLWGLISLILFLGLGIIFPSRAQQIPNDPFQAYLTKVPPEIIIDHGIEKLPDGIRLRKLVFRSRSLSTDRGVAIIKVFAAIAYPAAAGRYPAVIRLHGGGGKADLDVAENFARQGYVCLVLDIPGVADEIKNNKEGAWPKLPMITAKPDVTHSALFSAVAASVQAFYLLRSQPEVDTTRMGIAGGSWGGYVATMLSTLVNQDVAATWSVFGTGNFLAGANEKPNIEKLPLAEKEAWLKYLDPGMRAANITKPYYIITASNDRHWSWMAVQATLSSVKGHTSVLYSPNDNHKINYPGSWKMMEFFNHYLKNTGPPLPELAVEKAQLNKQGQLDVILKPVNAGEMVKVNVFYSDPALVWTEREWKQVPAFSAGGKKFIANIPGAGFKEGVDWYATITDKNSVWSDSLYSASTWIHELRKNDTVFAQDPFLPYLNGNPPIIVKELGKETNDSVTIRRVLFHSRDVQANSGIISSNIFAVITRPAKPGKYPGLLVLHGGGGFAEVEKAIKWAAQGYVVVALDEPGIAYPEKAPLSEGHWKNYPYGQHRFTAKPDVTESTVFDGVLSSVQGLYLLRAQNDVIKDRIGVVGVSWGGYLSTMLTGIAGRYIHASFSVFGSGFYDYGSSFLRELNVMPGLEKRLWLKYLDAGRRIEKVKSPFFLAAAANDNFFYPPAVMATLNAMKGPVNQLFAANANHKIPVPGGSITRSTSRPGWLEMEQTWFDYYLKGKGQPFPRISQASQVAPEKDTINHSATGKIHIHVMFKVKSSCLVTEAKVFYSVRIPDWTKRNWLSVDAVKSEKGGYYAVFPAERDQDMDWFASISDTRPTTVSSMIIPAVNKK